MDWSYKFEELQRQINALSEKADALAEAYCEAEDFTRKFLTECSKHHIKIVSIGKATNKVEWAKDWPFEHTGSVFADARTRDGWPAIWRVVEKMGISGGCGNTGQHNVKCNGKLVDGVYEFKDGKWRKVE